MSPTSQKAAHRPISFVLTNASTGLTRNVPLVIRPEDLTHSQPSLMSAQQTFGGAFVDDFGAGLQRIQISGHTGWRGGPGADGVQAFETMKSTVLTEYREGRAQAVAEGRDPNEVKLVFADVLDDIACVVAPEMFALKRNRSRPLLMVYNINLLVISEKLDDPLDDPLSFLGGPNSFLAGLKGLAGSAKTIAGLASRARSFVDQTLANPVGGFLTLAGGGLGKAVTALNGARNGVTTPGLNQVVGLAADIAQAGNNAFNMLGGQALAGQVFGLMQTASTFGEAYCTLRNAFGGGLQFTDLSDMFGASNCSSTVGGSPISPLLGRNPFEVVVPTAAGAPLVSSAAKASLDLLRSADPVLNPMAPAEVAARMASIVAGVTFR